MAWKYLQNQERDIQRPLIWLSTQRKDESTESSPSKLWLMQEFVYSMVSAFKTREGCLDVWRCLKSFQRKEDKVNIDKINLDNPSELYNPIVRDQMILWAFGLRDPALSVLMSMCKTMQGGIISGGTRCTIDSLASSLSTDELKLITDYYKILSDAESLQVVPSGCFSMNEKTISALIQQYNARGWSDITYTVASFVVCDSCCSILSQLTKRSAMLREIP